MATAKKQSVERQPEVRGAEAIQQGKAMLVDAFPAIMADVIEDARTIIIPCCNDATCKNCSGKGEIRKPGDKHARDLIFKAAQEFGSSDSSSAFPPSGRGAQEFMEP